MTKQKQEHNRIVLGYDKMNFCGTELELDLYTDVEPNSSSLDEYDIYGTNPHELLARERWTITVQVAIPSSSDIDLLWSLPLQDECYQIRLDNKFKGLFNKCYLQLPYRTGPCLVLDFNAYALEDKLLLEA